MSYNPDARVTHPHRQRALGFTLIELLVVIAIIATLAAVVAPAVFRNVGDAKVSAAKSQLDIFALALDSYRLDNDVFPTTAQGLERASHCAHRQRCAAQLARALSPQVDSARSVGPPVSLRRSG